MAVTETKLIRSLGGTNNSDGQSTASLLWHVITDSLQDDHFTATESPDLPAKSSEYDFFGKRRAGLYLTGYQAALKEADASRFLWHVTGNYTTAGSQSDNKQDEQSGDPLDMTPKISIYHIKERKPILRDLNNKLIASSAGEPYDPVQEVDRTRTMVRIVRNVRRCDPVTNQRFQDTLNLTIWSNFPAESVKCETAGAIEVLYTAGGSRYYQETWEFSLPVRGVDIENTWETRQIKLLDYGMYRITAGERETIRDNLGKPLPSATLLDGNGVPLDPGDDPVFLPIFDVYELAEFGAIGLPERI